MFAVETLPVLDVVLNTNFKDKYTKHFQVIKVHSADALATFLGRYYTVGTMGAVTRGYEPPKAFNAFIKVALEKNKNVVTIIVFKVGRR